MQMLPHQFSEKVNNQKVINKSGFTLKKCLYQLNLVVMVWFRARATF